MRICFVTRGGVRTFSKRSSDEKVGLTLFCFEELEVDYTEELEGKTHLFEDVANLSKKEDNVVVLGTQTKAYGQREIPFSWRKKAKF